MRGNHRLSGESALHAIRETYTRRPRRVPRRRQSRCRQRHRHSAANRPQGKRPMMTRKMTMLELCSRQFPGREHPKPGTLFRTQNRFRACICNTLCIFCLLYYYIIVTIAFFLRSSESTSSKKAKHDAIVGESDDIASPFGFAKPRRRSNGLALSKSGRGSMSGNAVECQV